MSLQIIWQWNQKVIEKKKWRLLKTIFVQVNELCHTADVLSSEQPNFESEILIRKAKIEDQWDTLRDTSGLLVSSFHPQTHNSRVF